MATINFYRVDLLPDLPEASSIYWVRDQTNATDATMYIIGTDPTDIRQISGGGGSISGGDATISITPDSISTSVLGTTGWTATASSTYPSNNPIHAFNGVLPDGWGSAVGDQLGWLEYDAGPGNTFIPNSYSLYRDSSMPGGWSSNSYSPKDWEIFGRKEAPGSTDVLLDTRTNQLIASDQAPQTFTINNTSNDTYRYLRIKINANHGFSYTNITEIDIYNVQPGGASAEYPLYWKVISSTISISATGTSTVTHGLSKDLIVSVDVKIKDSEHNLDQYTGEIGKLVSVKWDDTSVYVINKDATNILGQQCDIIVKYRSAQALSTSTGATIPAAQDW